MKMGYERPFLLPLPRAGLYLGFENKAPTIVEIGPCPFCFMDFDPVWDCTLTSCLYAYHPWCLSTYFAKSSKCIATGYDAEAHESW